MRRRTAFTVLLAAHDYCYTRFNDREAARIIWQAIIEQHKNGIVEVE